MLDWVKYCFLVYLFVLILVFCYFVYVLRFDLERGKATEVPSWFTCASMHVNQSVARFSFSVTVQALFCLSRFVCLYVSQSIPLSLSLPQFVLLYASCTSFRASITHSKWLQPTPTYNRFFVNIWRPAVLSPLPCIHMSARSFCFRPP